MATAGRGAIGHCHPLDRPAGTVGASAEHGPNGGVVDLGPKPRLENGNAGEGFGGVGVGGFLAHRCACQESRRANYVGGQGFEPWTSAV